MSSAFIIALALTVIMLLLPETLPPEPHDPREAPEP